MKASGNGRLTGTSCSSAFSHGKPQQNAYVERYNRTVRHEWLDHYAFASVGGVQDYATQRLWNYNNDYPNIGNGGITPGQKLKLLTGA